MSTATKVADSNRFMSTAFVLLAVLFGYLMYSLVDQFNDWFDLEVYISNYVAIKTASVVALSLLFFFVLNKNKSAKTYTQEVFGELFKVVWPDKDSVTKLTVGIVIAVVICSAILVLVDFLVQKLLGLLY
jgi:preprotein translocase subunit SecE